MSAIFNITDLCHHAGVTDNSVAYSSSMSDCRNGHTIFDPFHAVAILYLITIILAMHLFIWI